MNLVSQLLDYMLANNSAPAYRERKVPLNEVLDTPCRAFYIAEHGTMSYRTAGGDLVENKPVMPAYHPVRVTEFIDARNTQGNAMEVWIVW